MGWADQQEQRDGGCRDRLGRSTRATTVVPWSTGQVNKSNSTAGAVIDWAGQQEQRIYDVCNSLF